MENINYCSFDNGVKVCNVSSTLPNCSADNILHSDRRQLWMSLEGLPQFITLDLTEMNERPKYFKCFGFDCWHDYSSNPAVIELLLSTDAENFITWTTVYPELKQGIQLFQIDPLSKRYEYLKIIVKETFGASKTYLNQIYLFEEFKAIPSESVTESHQQTEQNSSQYRHFEREEMIERENREIRDKNSEIAYNDQYQMLAKQIQDMGREVASLKQSHQYNRQQQKQSQISIQPSQNVSQQKQIYHYREEAPPPEIYKMTPTDRVDISNRNGDDLNSMKKVISDQRIRIDNQDNQIQKLQKTVEQLIEKISEQDNQIQKIQSSQNSQAEISFQQKKYTQQNQQSNQQIPKIEEIIDKKITQLTDNYEKLLQDQETKFKKQYKELVHKFKKIIKKQKEQQQQQQQQLELTKSRRSHRKLSVSSQSSKQSSLLSQSSSSSIIEFIKSKRPKQSKSRKTSKQRNKSNKRSPSPTDSKENYKLDVNKQKKVAALVGKLKDKLQQRGQIAEKLNLSQRKTRKQRSLQNSSSDLSIEY